MKVEMTSADFEMGKHKVNICNVKANKYWMIYHHWEGNFGVWHCEELPHLPTQKKAIAEARRYLRAVNHV